MKIALLMLACLFGSAFAGESAGTLEDAKKLAASQNKPLLLEFFHPN